MYIILYIYTVIKHFCFCFLLKRAASFYFILRQRLLFWEYYLIFIMPFASCNNNCSVLFLVNEKYFHISALYQFMFCKCCFSRFNIINYFFQIANIAFRVKRIDRYIKRDPLLPRHFFANMVNAAVMLSPKSLHSSSIFFSVLRPCENWSLPVT